MLSQWNGLSSSHCVNELILSDMACICAGSMLKYVGILLARTGTALFAAPIASGATYLPHLTNSRVRDGDMAALLE
jgi:hypothetical protein